MMTELYLSARRYLNNGPRQCLTPRSASDGHRTLVKRWPSISSAWCNCSTPLQRRPTYMYVQGKKTTHHPSPSCHGPRAHGRPHRRSPRARCADYLRLLSARTVRPRRHAAPAARARKRTPFGWAHARTPESRARGRRVDLRARSRLSLCRPLLRAFTRPSVPSPSNAARSACSSSWRTYAR
jgi:hypothetical protein